MQSDTTRHGTPAISLLPSATERRAAVRLANERKASERRSELQSLTASTLSPHQRISTWERIHALKLPRSIEHPLVQLIASQTGLTVEDIGSEQRCRRELGDA